MSVVFITGGCANTGLAISKLFASKGWDVAVSSRDIKSSAATVEMLKKEYGVTARAYTLELGKVDTIMDAFAQVKRDFGRLDCFVANAANLGIGMGAFSTDFDGFNSVMEDNARGSFFCCQQAAMIMKEQGEGGAIVTIGSIQANGCVRDRIPYAMSKAAMAAMVRCLAYELGEYHIRVNNIVAGAIHSVRWNDIPEDAKALRRSRYPLGHEASEMDIANAVFYLGTDLSNSTSGTDLLIDSGLSTCILPYSKAES